MINLLPPDLKEEYKFARRNTSLLHIIGMFGVGIAGLGIIVASGLVYLQQAANTYANQAAATQQSLKDRDQAAIQKQAQEISGNLKLSVQVLSQEVLFSKLLQQLAIITPSNATLSGIAISQLAGAIDITAKTTDYNAATQLQVNLADPGNKIFDKADIVSITCITPVAGTSPANSRYPCTVVVRASFAKNNPFLFINSKVGA